MEASSTQQYSGNTVLSKVLLSIGVLLVVWNNYILPIPATLQWIIFAITILIAGVPHGALDHIVAKQNSMLQKKPFSSTQFLLAFLSFFFFVDFYPVIGISFWGNRFITSHFTEKKLSSYCTNHLWVIDRVTITTNTYTRGTTDPFDHQKAKCRYFIYCF
jgi:hypothetical protein